MGKKSLLISLMTAHEYDVIIGGFVVLGGGDNSNDNDDDNDDMNSIKM